MGIMTKRTCVICLLCANLVSSQQASAIEPDGPFQAHQKRNAAAWARQDSVINQKLSALETQFGKKPNIIYILADDVGWGEMGWQGGGKHRGTPTPTLDRMALEGMRFWCAYAEPSCTPSRIAMMTGRHPVRTGLLSVLWPGQTDGLSGKEVTVAEVLSKAGYNTAMWGKWHLGEEPEHLPENQGFDYAYYGLWNGAPDNWPGSHAQYKDAPNSHRAMFYDFPGEEEYLKRTGIDLSVAGYVGRKGKGRKPIEGVAGKLGPNRQEAFEAESSKQIMAYIKDNAKADNPFFIYWATYTQQLQGSKAHHNDKHVDKVKRRNKTQTFSWQNRMSAGDFEVVPLFAELGNAVKLFWTGVFAARGRSLCERRCSLRELYGTHTNLSQLEQHLLGGGLTPVGMRVRVAERSTTIAFARSESRCCEGSGVD